MLKVLFQLFLLYLAYKVIFDFIIPIYQTTKQVKKQMGDMHNRMEDQFRQQQPPTSRGPVAEPKPQRPSSDDYIDYEEVK